MKALFQTEDLVAKLDANVKQIEADVNDTMFVSFASEKDCLAAAMWLRQHGKLKGQKVRFRVKSKLVSSTSSATSYRQNAGYDYVQQMYYNMQQPQWQQNYYYQNYQNQQNNQKIRRQNSARGRGGKRRNNRNNYNNNNNNNNTPRKPYKKRSSRDNSNNEIFYNEKFTQVERTTFAQLTREAMARNESEPKCPKELKAIAALIRAEPKKGFFPKPLQQLGTISPHIPAHSYNKNLTEFDLNSFKKNAARNVERKNTKKQSQRGQNKKNKKKKKPQKTENKKSEETPKKEPIVTVIHDDEQKEEEQPTQETAI